LFSAFVAVTGPGWYPCGDEEMTRSGRSSLVREVDSQAALAAVGRLENAIRNGQLDE
jgi:hypothetical protein